VLLGSLQAPEMAVSLFVFTILDTDAVGASATCLRIKRVAVNFRIKSFERCLFPYSSASFSTEFSGKQDEVLTSDLGK
jgi:hypothetical protein